MSSADSHVWLHLTPIGAEADAKVTRYVRGSGSRLYDEAGNEYLDALAGNFCVQVGYGREEIVEAAAAQMRALAFVRNVGQVAPVTEAFATRLAEMSGMERVFFTTGGSEAVETALKLSRQYFRLKGEAGRTKFIGRRMAYHGATFGALSVNGVPSLRAPFEPLLPGARHAANNNCYHCQFGATYPSCGLQCAEAVRQVVEFEDPSTVAAVLVEPVQVTGGPFLPMPGYFERLREMCDEYGILLISDEVVCGFGRLAAPFGFERYGYRPDIVTIAKGMTSGYVPAGAALFSSEVAEAFATSRTMFPHILTYGGHPVACAVGLANLDILQREGLFARAGILGERLASGLAAVEALPIVGACRGEGLLWGVELVSDPVTRAPISSALATEIGESLARHRLVTRLDTRERPIIQLAPPLSSSETDIDEIASILSSVLTEAQARLETVAVGPPG